MKILIAGIVTKYQAIRLKEEAEKKGHILDCSYADDLTIYSDKDSFIPRIPGKDLTTYDLIYSFTTNRKWEWYLAYLYLHDNYKTIIVNGRIVKNIQGVYLSEVATTDYYRQTLNQINYPKSLTFYSTKAIPEIIKTFSFPVIIKSSVGRQGKYVFKAEGETDLKEIIEKLEVGKKAIIAREFIPNDGDIRVFIIDQKVVAGMKRTPKAGEFRSNIAQGGTANMFDLTNSPEIVNIALSAAKVTSTEIAGVDVMINKNNGEVVILEVNANPQFEGLEKSTNINVAEKIIEYFEKLFSERK